MSFGTHTFAEIAFGEVGKLAIAVPTLQLTITTTAPSRVVNCFRTPATAQLVITAEAATLAIGISPATAQLILTTEAPIFVEAFAAEPGTAQLTITTSAPSRARTTNPAPAETPWRDEAPLTNGWIEEDEAA